MEEVRRPRKSFFHNIRSRELNGFRARKRPQNPSLEAEVTEVGVMAVEHLGDGSPPLALSFCKTSKNSHIVAVSDVDGYVSLFDTRKKLSSFASHQENADNARIGDWMAHQNAIFDICWIKDDANMLTASGDQTIRIWDVERKKSVGVLKGHEGSVKSICSHPTNSDVLISGSRDGCFSLWDLRCNSLGRNKKGEPCIGSINTIKGVHSLPRSKRARLKKQAAAMSITSVLYLKDGLCVATAGAVDSVVKFWDARNLTVQVNQTCAKSDSNDEKEQPLHGISSLSQDVNGVLVSASCMDNRIYLFNILQLEKGPVNIFSGCYIQSFYVKSAISPDSSYLLSGSSDGSGYIWQVDEPNAAPMVLKGHDGEATAVAWVPTEIGKLATSADDCTVRTWNVQASCCFETRSFSTIRRRVMAMSPSDGKKLLMTEDLEGSECVVTKVHGHISSENSQQMNSTLIPPKVTTPKAQRNSAPSFEGVMAHEKTPEAALKSPSSVLNPPSSVKRTIRDYFMASS